MAVAKWLNANHNVSGQQAKVASNSLVVEQGSLLTLVGWSFVTLSWAGDTIEGVSVTKKTYASDNQTNALETVIYRPSTHTDNFYQMDINGGTVTAEDVGKFYDINASQEIDGITESTTTGQMRLEKFVSGTVWVFSIANA